MLLPLAVPIAIGIEQLGKFMFKFFNYLRIFNQIINENNRFHLLNMLIKKAEGKTFGFAPPPGLEPGTPWLTVMCSNQLS